MPFLPPNQQRQSTEGTCRLTHKLEINKPMTTREKTASAIKNKHPFNGPFLELPVLPPNQQCHNTTGDAILTCSQKPTQVSLIYRTEGKRQKQNAPKTVLTAILWFT